MKIKSYYMKLRGIILFITILYSTTSCNTLDKSFNSDAAKISVINKWHFNIFPNHEILARSYMLATLMDPVIYEVADEYKENLDSKTLGFWLQNNFKHTQSLYNFADLPGRDPWGVRNDSESPTFKKLLPSEMKAMSMYNYGDPKIGKCLSLAVFHSNAMIASGTDPDDVVLFNLLDSGMHHTVAVVKNKDEYILFNNNRCRYFRTDESFIDWLQKRKDVIGYFNHFFSYCNKKIDIHTFTYDFNSFTFNDNIIMNNSLSLMENIKFFTKVKTESDQIDIIHTFETREELVETVFTNRENKLLFDLTKYAYQSFDVEEPSLYLEASLITSGPKDLSSEFSTIQDFFNWLSANIGNESIFGQASNRIMTAEQVIVFKKGNAVDRAVLAHTILYHMGYHSIIKITRNNAFICVEDLIYDLTINEVVSLIKEDVENEFKI